MHLNTGFECKFFIFKITKSSFVNDYPDHKIVLMFSSNLHWDNFLATVGECCGNVAPHCWGPTSGQCSDNIGPQRFTNTGDEQCSNVGPQHCWSQCWSPTLDQHCTKILLCHLRSKMTVIQKFEIWRYLQHQQASLEWKIHIYKHFWEMLPTTAVELMARRWVFKKFPQ